MPSDLTLAGKPIDPAIIAVLAAAETEMQRRHRDFAFWRPVMEQITPMLTPRLDLIDVCGYLEVLYFAAKFADFAAPLRHAHVLRTTPLTQGKPM